MRTRALPCSTSVSIAAEPGIADGVLREYFVSKTAGEARALLGQLVAEHALPAIRGIVSHKLASDSGHSRGDIDDVCAEVVSDLVARLQDLKASNRSGVIRDFQSYVAVAAYNASSNYFRQKYPQRRRLSNRVRYLLTKDPRFGLWQDPTGEWYCGPKVLMGKTDQYRRQAVDESEPFGQERTRDAAALLGTMLADARSPVRFEDLVDRMAEHSGVSEEHAPGGIEVHEIADSRENAETSLDRRSWLQQVWAEITELPVKQRFCLLLNLRDHQGGPAIALLPATGVASIRKIAEALEMAPEELAALWKDLPLEDSAVASRLGITRQQVINLRKTARERLARKTRR